MLLYIERFSDRHPIQRTIIYMLQDDFYLDRRRLHHHVSWLRATITLLVIICTCLILDQRHMVQATLTDVAQGRPLIDVRNSLINDGDITSAHYWSEQPSSGWIELDLLATVTSTHIMLWHVYDDERTYQSVVVHVSKDGGMGTWTQVYNNDDTGSGDFSAWCGVGPDRAYHESSAGLNITFDRLMANDGSSDNDTSIATLDFRYVRVHGVGPHSDDLIHTIVELQVYDINTHNVALHAPVTMWHSGITSGYNGYPVTIGPKSVASHATVDLLHTWNISAIHIGLVSQDEELVCAIVVQLSSDRSSWFTMFNNDHADVIGQGVGTDTITPAPLLVMDVPPIAPDARYIRIWLRCGDDDAQILTRVRAWANFPDAAYGRPSSMINGHVSARYGNDGILAQLLDKPYEDIPAADARCAATQASADGDAWWMVDMGRQKYNYVLMLYQLLTPAFTQRLAHFQVFVGNTTTSYDDGTAVHVYNASQHHNMWAHPHFQVPLGGILGRYIWIAVWGTQRIITICEAMISACPPGCHANDGYGPCVDIDECAVNNGGCGTYGCINLDGGHMCRPVVDERSFRIDGAVPSTQDGQLMLDRTEGGQLLTSRITWMGRTFPITIQYGSLGRIYTCSDATLTPIASPETAPVYEITCRSAAGVGTNMSLWLEITPFDQPVSITWPRGKLAYRYPDVYAGTLELIPSAQSPSTYLNIYDTKKSPRVAFNGHGFAADADRLLVYLGDDELPYRYPCPLVITGDERTTYNRIICTIPAGGSGPWYHFNLLVSGSDIIFPGSDQVNFVTRSEILNVTGCAMNEPYGASTYDCPTEGNITIIIQGVNFVPPVTLMVGSYACRDVMLRSPTLMTCTLSAGIGSLLAITGTSGTLPIVSDRVTLSYGHPTIESLSSSVCITDPLSSVSLIECSRQGGVLILEGVNFGGTTLAQVLVGGKFCKVLMQTNRRIECHLAGGSGKFVAITIIQGGQTSNTGPMISYDDCPLGYVGDMMGSSTCMECTQGKFAELRGQPTCASCARGLYSNITAASTCERCHPGTVTPTQGASQCVDCEIGHYVEAYAQAACLPCWTGSMIATTGAAECKNCAMGRYAPSTGMTECWDCDVGEFIDTIGEDYCKFCARGQYGNATGQTGCYDCAPGSYSSAHGVSTCDACGHRQYQHLHGQTFCYSCAPNEYLVNPLSNNKPCAACPDGAICTDNGGIVARPGFYVLVEDGVAQTYECLPKSCLAGDICAANASVVNVRGGFGTYSQSCCALNRANATENLLCASCEPGYSVWGNECVHCERANLLMIFALAMVMWAYLIVFHRLAQSTAAETRILLNYGQMVLLLFGPDAPWTTWLSMLNFNVFLASGQNCVTPATSLQKLTSGVYLPLACFGLILLTALIHAAICYIGFKFPTRVSPRVRALFGYTFMKSPYLRTCINLVLWSYNSIVGAVVRFFSCQTVGSHQLLPEYPDIDCSSDGYLRLRTIYYGLGFGIVIGVPIALLIGTLTMYYRGLLVKDAPYEARYEKLRTRYGVLFEVYRPNRFYWEVPVLLRRTILTGIFVALPVSRAVKCALVVIANVAFLFMHMLGKPYISSIANLFESLSIATLTVTAAVLSVATPPLDLPIAIGLTALVFGIGAIFLIYFLRKVRRDLRVRIARIQQRRKTNNSASSSIANSSMHESLLDDSFKDSPDDQSIRDYDHKQVRFGSGRKKDGNSNGGNGDSEISMKLMTPLQRSQYNDNELL